MQNYIIILTLVFDFFRRFVIFFTAILAVLKHFNTHTITKVMKKHPFSLT